jgi:hypothetical protein
VYVQIEGVQNFGKKIPENFFLENLHTDV